MCVRGGGGSGIRDCGEEYIYTRYIQWHGMYRVALRGRTSFPMLDLDRHDFIMVRLMSVNTTGAVENMIACLERLGLSNTRSIYSVLSFTF